MFVEKTFNMSESVSIMGRCFATEESIRGRVKAAESARKSFHTAKKGLGTKSFSGSGVGKPHKFRPGTVVLHQI